VIGFERDEDALAEPVGINLCAQERGDDFVLAGASDQSQGDPRTW
jgi:hypothetical protein